MRTGPVHLDPATAEGEANLEPHPVLDLLELNHELSAHVQQLKDAVASHGRIGIAAGLVMARHHIAVDDALRS